LEQRLCGGVKIATGEFYVQDVVRNSAFEALRDLPQRGIGWKVKWQYNASGAIDTDTWFWLSFLPLPKGVGLFGQAGRAEIAAGERIIQNPGIKSLLGNTVDKSPSTLGHIFKPTSGHIVPPTEILKERMLLLYERVANNPSNLRLDALQAGLIDARAAEAGVQVFTQTYSPTKQIWVFVRNGRIYDAGMNLKPR
jgi:hypothetical protein